MAEVTYTLEITATAKKQLAKIGQQQGERLIEAIHALKQTPRPHGAKKLEGRVEWRIRVGDYRVVYKIEDTRLLVIVIKVGHRGEIYRSR